MLVRSIARVTAVFVGVSALLVLILYATDLFASMRLSVPEPWTSVGILAVGISLYCSLRESQTRASELTRYLCAGLILAIAFATLTQNLAQVDFGIDQLLFPSLVSTVHSGRPASAAGFNFFLLGIALLAYRGRRSGAMLLCEATALASLTFCYLYLADLALKNTLQSTRDRMAPATALLLLMSAATLLFSRVDGKFVSLLRSSGAAGILARWLMPVPFLLTMVTRLIRNVGAYFHLFESQAQVLTYLDILCALFVVWRAASQVLRLDKLRQQAEQDLRNSRDDLDQQVQLRTQELQIANATLNNLVDASPLAICAWNTDGSIRKSNAAADSLLRPNAELFEPLITRAKQGEAIAGAEVTISESTSSAIYQVWAYPLRTESRVQNGTLVFAADVSERKAFDNKLLQTQKLESLGVLAGGIAHDFNNLLTGIMGNTSLLLETQAHDPFAIRMLEQVITASHRAADLTGQMLAYAGKGRFVLVPVDLSKLVREIGTLMQSSIGQQVRIKFQLSTMLPMMEMDPNQIQQVVMNLVINAAEAISESGGEVWVSTSIEQLEADFIRRDLQNSELPAGRYIRLEVRDNGSGMDEKIKARIFEPFFTTKFTGRGLGLAAVHGIVRSHNGGLFLDSAPGKGTTFQLFFPAFQDAGKEAARKIDVKETSNTVSPARRITVLVIDDESLVREVAFNALHSLNYRVEASDSGNHALELLTQLHADVDVIVLDLTMPGLSGRETHARLKELLPAVPILVSSGFDQDEAERYFDGTRLDGFIQKPYTASHLVAAVNSLLHRNSVVAEA